MKTLFMALELGDDVLTNEEVANFFNVNVKAVTVRMMNKCIGVHRTFRNLTDIYLWTCKYWYGLYEGKLTYVRIKGVDDINSFFSIKYAQSFRFAVVADTVKMFSDKEINFFADAIVISYSKFDEERVMKLKPLVKKFQHSYKILFCANNPY